MKNQALIFSLVIEKSKWFFTSASIKLIGNKKTNAAIVGFFIILICMGWVPVYIFVLHVHIVPTEARIRCQIL